MPIPEYGALGIPGKGVIGLVTSVASKTILAHLKSVDSLEDSKITSTEVPDFSVAILYAA
jgi:hypothetical protein